MLNKIICSLSLISTVAILTSSANAKPLKGIYIPYASDIFLEIENNRFREGADIETGSGNWQPFSNLKEILDPAIPFEEKVV